jgi:hypothetical protein
MAIICIRLGAKANFASKVLQPSFGPDSYAVIDENLLSRVSNETAFRMGDYRDILNLTRVLVHGPQSKADVDFVIERLSIFLLLEALPTMFYYPYENAFNIIVDKLSSL